MAILQCQVFFDQYADIKLIESMDTALSAKEIRGFMDEETWFTAAEAVEHGFAEEQIEHEAAAASISVDIRYAYKHTPERFCGSDEGNKKPPETVREVEAVLRDSGFSRKESVDIAAHGFEPEQRDSAPEDDQRDSEPAVEETETVEKNVILENRKITRRKSKTKGVENESTGKT